MNVIDTLSAGFGAANKRLWIVSIPIVVDLFLWLGPKIVIGPSLTRMALSSIPEQASGYSSLLQQSLAGLNVLALLAVYLPSLVVRLDSIGPLASLAPVTPIDSPWQLTLFSAVAALVGLWISCLYLGFLAQQVRDGATSVPAMSRAIWRYWTRVLLFLLLVAGSVAVLAVPVGIGYAIAVSASPAAGEFLAFLLQVAIIWGIIYLFFAVQALLLSEVGPIRAVRYSVMVIAGNFWSSIAFIGLTFLISVGLPIAWQTLAATPWGLMIGIIGNAYVGTGIAAAGFLFYQQRLERVQQLAAAKTATEAR